MPSSLPGAVGNNKDTVKVQVFVADVNDNKPFFTEKRYEARIKENAEMFSDVKSIRAQDLDKHSILRYDLNAAEGQKIPFGVKTDSGTIFLKEKLDFEAQNLYHLLLTVTDGLYNATTSVIIHVEDVNDNAPSFSSPSYSTTIEENSEVPKRIFTVKASDLDREETNGQIIYELEGQGVEYFSIDAISGEIFVTKPIRATDKGFPPLEGVANVTIKITDVNDSPPFFDKSLYETLVPETAPVGSAVWSFAAFDNDNEASDNIFTYDLVDDSHEYFYMTTEAGSNGAGVGVLRIKKVGLMNNSGGNLDALSETVSSNCV
uniref:Cadherin domain-containing protein n=1 Tax=Panagrolaimus sp. JU765 TaxID=591449 RepID=A0AC34QM08_9BILA